jgi:hypothetical protein
MKRWWLASLLLMSVLAGLVFHHRLSGQQSPLATVGQIHMLSFPVDDQLVNNGYPSLFMDSRGMLWCAWVSTRLANPGAPNPGITYQEGDDVVARVRRQGQWSEPLRLNTNFGVNFEPVIGEDGAGNIHVVWSSRRGNEYALYSRRVGADLSLGSEIQVLPSGQFEGHPSLAADNKGRLWLTAHSFRQGSSDIVLRVLDGSGWRYAPDAAATADPEFRPRLALAPDGGLWCAWDAYSDGKYRVWTRRFDTGREVWGSAETVPGDGALDAYAPDLAVDSGGRLWVAYARNEVELPAWGLRGPKPGGPPRPTTRIAVRDASGWTFPMPTGGKVAVGDLPRVVAGSGGSVWVLWQFLKGHVDWKVGAAHFQGASWSGGTLFGETEPVSLDGNRRADQRAAAVVDRTSGNLLLAYERGRGTFRNRDIYFREVQAPPAAAGKPDLVPFTAAELKAVPRSAKHAPDRESVVSSNGERHRLYFGDLHNHLLIDDGHEGSVDQLMLMHRDRYGMDFAATTSHGDSNKLLISELAHNDAFTEVLLQPGRFVTIPGFEWTQGDFVVPRAGHRHVIYETSGGPLYRPTEGHSDSIREFVDLMSRTNGLIFAHHISRGFTGGTDWTYVNVRIEPAVEIASSWGRFEFFQNPGHIRVKEAKDSSVRDAWKRGWRLGVIGGSDGHNLFGDRIQGLTGIYAAELTRPALFDALRKRRCYATTGEPIELLFQVNGNMMGSEITAADGPVVEAQVVGTAQLEAVEVIKHVLGTDNFEVVHNAVADGLRSKVWWKDPNFNAASMYYLRVTQKVSPELAEKYKTVKDNPFPSEMAWSSPVWVERRN